MTARRTIAVRTDVAFAVLIDGLAAEVDQRARDPLPPATGRALQTAYATVLESQPASAGATIAAARLARAGYLARVVEHERFERAREPAPDFERLIDATDDAVTLSARLAREEPAERPDPDDERATSWRIPGPGGHIRHHLAMLAARSGGDRLERDDAKRCWMFGFFLRCYEEMAEGR